MPGPQVALRRSILQFGYMSKTLILSSQIPLEVKMLKPSPCQGQYLVKFPDDQGVSI
jgi:hypothetical protein